MKVISRLLQIVTVVVLALLALSSCSSISGVSTHGKVVEKGTNKPIPDAIVVVEWGGQDFAMVESRTICVHVETTQTNNEGDYHTPSWRAHSKIEPAFLVQMEIGVTVPYAYKPGYEWTETKNGVIYLEPSVKSSKERLEWLWGEYLGNSCAAAGSSEKNLFPLYKALYEEAKPLATESKEDQLTLHFMRKITARVLFPEEKDGARQDQLINEYLKDHLQ